MHGNRRRIMVIVISSLALIGMLLPLLMTISGSGTDTQPTPDQAAAPGTDLIVQVLGVDGSVTAGQVRCGDNPIGAGPYAENPDAACDAIAANTELFFPAADEVCTDVYGSSQQALVQGMVEGRQVETTFDRTDGCGIDAWDALTALLGPATTDSGATGPDVGTGTDGPPTDDSEMVGPTGPGVEAPGGEVPADAPTEEAPAEEAPAEDEPVS